MGEIKGYKLLELLHETSSQAVWRGLRVSDQRPVVLKVPAGEYPSAPQQEGYRTEYSVTRALASDNVVSALALEPTDNGLVLVLEDFGGVSLDSYDLEDVDTGRRLTIALSAARAMVDVHARGYVHCDVKPSNIIVEPRTGRVRLTDFHLAVERSRSGAAAARAGSGSLPYISPEQTGRLKRSVDYRSDYYSFGATLYELFTGRPPFPGTDDLELVHSHVARVPASPHEVAETVPRSLSEVILKLLAKNPENRYQSAKGLLTDLELCRNMVKEGWEMSSFRPGLADVSDVFRLSDRIYGRKGELDRLRQVHSRAEAGSRELVVLSGQAGMGKTTLSESLRAPTIRCGGVFLSGKYDQYRRDVPCSGIVAALRGLLSRILRLERAEMDVWRKRLGDVLGDNAQIIVDILPELGSLLGPQPPVSPLPPAESRHRFTIVFRNFVRTFPENTRLMVLVLDDLQWADSDSLDLIQTLLSDESAEHLLIIGSCRSDEKLGAQGPFEFLRQPGKRSFGLTFLHLSPLGVEEVNQLVSDTLSLPQTKTRPLAEMVHSQAEGNPLYVREYLKTLHQEGVIDFDTESTSWCWDLIEARKLGMGEQSQDFLRAAVARLPGDTRALLGASATVGSPFGVRSLMGALDWDRDRVVSALEPALERELVLPASGGEEDEGASKDVRYVFLHDRVQQAAHELLDEGSRKDVLLRSARHMATDVNPDDRDEIVFELVSRYNQARGLLDDPGERREVARLNLLAGCKALASTAYRAAGEYLTTGQELLEGDQDSRLYLDLGLHRFQALFMSGSEADAEALYEDLMRRVTDLEERTRLLTVKVTLYTAASRYEEAVHLALHGLRMHRLKLEFSPGRWPLLRALAGVRLALRGRSPEGLLQLPPMEESLALCRVELLMALITPAYMFDKGLTALAVLQLVRLSIRHGNTGISAYGYMFYAVILASRFGRYGLSRRYAQLALQVNERYGTGGMDAKLYLLYGSTINHWGGSLDESLDMLERAYLSGVQTGDIVYARYASYFLVHYLLLKGEPLDSVLSRSEPHLAFADSCRNALASGMIRLARQFCLVFKGETAAPGSLDGEGFRWTEHLALAEDSGGEVASVWSRFVLFMVRMRFGEYSKAALLADELAPVVESSLLGMLFVPHFHAYHCVCLAMAHRADKGAMRKHVSEVMDEAVGRLGVWERGNPAVFRHLRLLAQGARALHDNRHSVALQQLNLAVDAAREAGCVQDMGLACELAASLYAGQNDESSADVYLREAFSSYSAWGASELSSRLVVRFSGMGRSAPTVTGTGGMSMCGSDEAGPASEYSALDLSAVIRASQAISREIEIHSLLEQLMRIVVESAGAEKGAILLRQGGRLQLAALADMHGDGVRVRREVEEPLAEVLAETAVQHVVKRQRQLVLDDISQDERFREDRYVSVNQPRSVLVMPILQRGSLLGVISLENSLVSGAFTSERLEVIRLIASQAAISIQNARLYTELKASEHEQRTLLENLSVGVYRATPDRKGHVVRSNPALARIFGCEEEDFRNIDILNAYQNEKDRDAFLRELFVNGEVRDRVIALRRLDGTPIWCSVSVSLQRDEAGNVRWVDGVVEDVTERRRTEELRREKVAADAANRAKSEFLASMSHEIRTPMNAIMGIADLLWESELSAEQRKYVRLFKSSGESLLALINDILDLSKVESGQVELEQAPFDLSEIMGEVGSIMAFKAHEKGLELVLDVSPGTPVQVLGDSTRLRQVLVNLVGNAVKFTDKGEIVVELASAANPHTHVFRVRDTGIGIPADKQRNIFDSFTQADSSTTRKYGGTGLGLTICKRLVELMGGEISVESAPGEGAVFAFTVNLPAARQAPEDGDVPQGVVPDGLAGVATLLVEDNEAAMRVQARMLRELGLHVDCATSCRQALELFRQAREQGRPYRLCVLDSTLSEAGPPGLTETLLSGDDPPGVVQLIVSEGPAGAISRTRRGGVETVPKPVDRGDIRLAAMSALGLGDASAVESVQGEQTVASGERELPRILLVDDSDSNRLLIEFYLDKQPFELRMAENGQEAVELFERETFSLVLMDMQMPVMGGLEATRIIRDMEVRRGSLPTPVVALTANAFKEDEERCLKAGCTGFLAKPIKKASLLDAISSYIDNN